MNSDGFWTTRELAEKTGLDQSHIRRLLIEGKISGRKIGRDWLIPDSEAQRWLGSRKRKTK
jgi:excisionase family DNA binding protein